MRVMLLLGCALCLSACQYFDGYFASPAELNRPIPAYDQHSLIIRYHEDSGDAALLQAAAARGDAVLSRYPMLSALILAVPPDSDLGEARHYYQSLPGVREINFRPLP